MGSHWYEWTAIFVYYLVLPFIISYLISLKLSKKFWKRYLISLGILFLVMASFFCFGLFAVEKYWSVWRRVDIVGSSLKAIIGPWGMFLFFGTIIGFITNAILLAVVPCLIKKLRKK